MKKLILILLLFTVVGCGTKIHVRKNKDSITATMNSIGKLKVECLDKAGNLWKIDAESQPSNVLPEIPALLQIDLGKKEGE